MRTHAYTRSFWKPDTGKWNLGALFTEKSGHFYGRKYLVNVCYCGRMPTYVYKFDDGVTVEVAQGIHEDAHTSLRHPETREVAPVKRCYVGVGTILKGAGWYRTSSRPTTSTE